MMPTHPINRKIVIWGRDHYNLLGILRQLVPFWLDVEVLFVSPLNGCTRYSKYCKKYRIFDNPQEILAYLLSNYQDELEKPILIVHSDEYAEIIDLHRKELSSYFMLTGTKRQGLLTQIQNKNEMAKLALECGSLVPRSMSMDRDTDLSAIPLPCFVRSALNTPSVSWNGRVKCETKEEVLQIQRNISKEDRLIVSEYIPKEFEILVIGVRFHDGSLYVPGCLIRDRWLAGDSGSGSHGLVTPEIPSYINVDAIRLILEKIDYYGQFSVEYGILNDVAYFYEVNLRNDGTSDYFNQCGANTNLAWVYDCCGLDKKDICVPVKKPVFMINEIQDLNNIKEKRITIKEWMRQWKEAQVYVYWNRHDMMPYFVMMHKYLQLWRIPKRVFNRLKRLFVKK